ncbi:unnamed protein product [Calypogeia fissa]
MAFRVDKEQQTSSQQRRLLCCYCSSLLLLPICWVFFSSSFGLPYYLPHAQDLHTADQLSLTIPITFNSALSTSLRKSSNSVDHNPGLIEPMTWTLLEGEKYMWYSPQSGFSNQARQLMNALKIAFLLNRTLVLPPVLDHFELEQGTCLGPLRDQPELRKLAWAAIASRFEPASPRRYVSMADIIDLSSISSTVKTIDLRVFLALWCGIDISRTCSGPVCRTLARELQSMPRGSISSCAAQFFSAPGLHNGPNHIHEVDDDCRTTIWTSGESSTEKEYLEELMRQQLQSDTTLPSNINASSINIKHKDVIETLGPASTAGGSFLLAFGTLFSRYYNGRTLMVDINATRHRKTMAHILTAIESQTFSVDILDAGRYFVQEKIVGPFFCTHVRLDDGVFTVDRETNTFGPLRQRLRQLEEISNQITKKPLNVFLMTDLPREKWRGTYLHDMHVNPMYKIYTMDGEEELLNDVIQKMDSHEYGLMHGFLPKLKILRKVAGNGEEDEIIRRWDLDMQKSSMSAFSVRLFVEEVVCSCATLGFQGTLASTITRNILNMREAQMCPIYY